VQCLCSPEHATLPRYGSTDASPRVLADGHLCACAPDAHARPRLRRGGSSNSGGPLAAQSAQFERLLAGAEAAGGERPPPYGEVVAGRA
jgi:hypothetical protein